MNRQSSTKKVAKNSDILKIKYKTQKSNIESTVVKNHNKDSRTHRENFNFLKAKQSLHIAPKVNVPAHRPQRLLSSKYIKRTEKENHSVESQKDGYFDSENEAPNSQTLQNYASTKSFRHKIKRSAIKIGPGQKPPLLLRKGS